MTRTQEQPKPRNSNTRVGPPRWADPELFGFYCTPRTEHALIECINIRESIGRQLGGFHCANVRMILYRNNSPQQYYDAARWEGIKRLLVKYAGWLEDICKTGGSTLSWLK